MTNALFRVASPSGAVRLARGDPETGPAELLPEELKLDRLLAGDGTELAQAPSAPGVGPAAGWRVLAPIESQEVWAAGVTYERSRTARMEESAEPSIYDRVYDARRPELFFKSVGWRVRGPGEPIGVRADSTWDVPEPELALVIAASGTVAGFTIGNDVSSRSIEGENPLYLPQAKVYEGSCALGPCIVPASEVGDLAATGFGIRLVIERDGRRIAEGATTSSRIRHAFDDLARWLLAAYSLPQGAVLLTGTGIVPDPPFTLTAGDLVRIEIDGLGTLQNPVVSVGAVAPGS
jgi:2-dehydro-3-deoxy-D-arabinonate dehydratase